MSVFMSLVLPGHLVLTQADYEALAASCGTGQIITGLAPIYYPYMTEADLPAVFTQTTTEACDRVVLDLGWGETLEYDDCYITSEEIIVDSDADCAVTVLDSIFGEGAWR